MESIFIVNRFETDFNVAELYDNVYAQEAYCIDILEIPDEKIYGTEMVGKGLLEVVLSDIQQDELLEAWYLNLHKVSA
jgi:hypothetical protein